MTDTRRWTGGTIFTGLRRVEALLVDDGRVVHAGTDTEVRRESPTGTEHEHLEGRLLLPGFVDAHLHLGELARYRTGLSLHDVNSAESLRTRVAEWAILHPTGPVVGRGWDPEGFRDPASVDLRTLDRAVEDRPVVLYHVSGHAALVNSEAMRKAADQGGPPPAAAVGRFSDGAPNGVLYEEALRWLGPVVAPTFDTAPSVLVETAEWVASFGLTTVVTMNAHPKEVSALAEAARNGRLPVRVRAYVSIERPGAEDLLRPPFPALDRFRVVGAKAFADGAFGPRTAWLSAPYSDAPEGSGRAVGEDEWLADRLATAAEVGLAPAVHAIGDRGLVRALGLLAPWSGDPSRPPARVEHAALTPPDLLPLLEAVHPALVVQPGFVWSDHWLGRRLGEERARWAYAFRTLLDRGFLLAGSSDAPFDPLDPWRGLRAAVERVDPDGRSANRSPHEALTPEEALRLYTVSAGLAVGEPDLGRLEHGARADLLVVRASNLSGALAASGPPSLETWVGGRRIHPRAAPVAGTTV